MCVPSFVDPDFASVAQMTGDACSPVGASGAACQEAADRSSFSAA